MQRAGVAVHVAEVLGHQELLLPARQPAGYVLVGLREREALPLRVQPRHVGEVVDVGPAHEAAPQPPAGGGLVGRERALLVGRHQKCVQPRGPS